jgi:surface glycoprotein (TIGR04207 family)
MTDYNDKARAVVLAALMVFSVFAGTVAFSGSAVGQSVDADNSSLTPTEVGQVTVSHDATVAVDNVDFSQSTNNASVTVNLGSGQPDLGSSTINSVEVNGSAVSASNYSVTSGANSVTVDINDTVASGSAVGVTVDADPLAVDWSGATGSQDITVDVTNTDGSSSTGNALATVSVSDSTTRSAPGSGEGTVYDGVTLFQGEEDIEFGGTTTSLVGVSGDAEGQTLTLPVDQDQATGQYDANGPESGDGGFAATVLEPRITDFEVLNVNDEDIAGGSVPEGESGESGSGALSVNASYNYEEAEDLELTVENEDGLDVTGDAIEGDDT